MLKMFVLNIFFVLFYTAGIHGLQKITCGLGDEACLKKAGERLSADIINFNGGPSSFVSDPLRLNDIKTNLPTITYTLHNAALSGMKDCIVKTIVFSEEYLNYTYQLTCGHLTTEAEYEANGTLNDLAMEGKGTLKATHDKYDIIYTGDYVLWLDDNGKKHIKLTEYTLKFDANGNVTYQYENLFNGDVEKSEAFNEYFSRDNWNTLDQILGDATMTAFQDQYIKNCNEYMNLNDIENIYYYYE